MATRGRRGDNKDYPMFKKKNPFTLQIKNTLIEWSLENSFPVGGQDPRREAMFCFGRASLIVPMHTIEQEIFVGKVYFICREQL